MTVQNIRLRSTALSFATYDDEMRVLTVTFTNGRSYTHPDVPPDVVAGLETASSAGSYYNEAIKGVYT